MILTVSNNLQKQQQKKQELSATFVDRFRCIEAKIDLVDLNK